MTVLVLDIESGSVASALVHVPADGAPKISAYHRKELPLLASRTGSDIAASLEKTLLHALSYMSMVAARMRGHAAAQKFGTVTGAAVFFAAPWGTPNLSTGKASYIPGMRAFTKEQVQAAFGDIPVSFYTSADAIAYGSRMIGKHQDTLVAMLRGELIELLLLNEHGPQAYSTTPVGSRSILRTLKTHGALSEHEARSMLALARHKEDLRYEPLLAAAHHLGDTFAEAAALLLPAGTPTGIVVVGEHPLGEWFAKNIAANARVADIFDEDATVEAIRPYHLGGLLEPGAVNDPFMLMESLFIK